MLVLLLWSLEESRFYLRLFVGSVLWRMAAT